MVSHNQVYSSIEFLLLNNKAIAIGYLTKTLFKSFIRKTITLYCFPKKVPINKGVSNNTLKNLKSLYRSLKCGAEKWRLKHGKQIKALCMYVLKHLHTNCNSFEYKFYWKNELCIQLLKTLMLYLHIAGIAVSLIQICVTNKFLLRSSQ